VAARPDKIVSSLARLDTALGEQAERLSVSAQESIHKWQVDAAALRFHLLPANSSSPITVILGGTGTGKSTLVNRLVGAAVTAASFRRTFTSGAVAVVTDPADLPAGWLGVDHIIAAPDDAPPRGQAGALVVVRADPPPPGVLIDTPDLDGDQPVNHAQADRAFRWAQRMVFVVTPEKYQMTELLPYYRLARRYALPALFVMNKCEEPDVLNDFRTQLAGRDWQDASIFVIPRDDAAYEPPVEANLDALRTALQHPIVIDATAGIRNRVADVVTRLTDQVIGPLREARRHADELTAALRAMEAPPLGVDVNPITQGLQRRLQQRSVLYLLGPQRMLDRVRQVPTLLARLPRATWDWVMGGQVPQDLIDPKLNDKPAEPPDFPATLAEQFTVVRSRIDDVLRNDPAGQKWITDDSSAYLQSLISPEHAAAIAADEVQQLRDWLGKRWNATPRDTRILQAMLKHLPGGKKLTQWSEAAPYLLTIIIVTHHALFPHFDLIVLGGYTLATWLTERISNEVSARTRSANRKIGERFERLAHDQIEKVCAWIDRQAPQSKELAMLERLTGDLAESAE
jgi:hypothetical protein